MRKKEKRIRIIAIFLCIMILLTGNSSYMLGTIVYAAQNETDSTADMRVSTTQLEELIRAVKLGFGDDVDDTSQITYAEYYRMLEKLVTLIVPDKLEQWQKEYPKARESREGLNRANAMYMIYAVAHDILGEAYCRVDAERYTFQTWGSLSAYMENPFGEKYPLDYTIFPDTAVEEELLGIGRVINRTANSYFFSFGQSSCNGYFLFDYDKATNSMRTTDAFTWQEAMWSVIRLYESVDSLEVETQWISIEDVGTYNKNIITDELLGRAQYMIEPTVENLPYYTGVQLSQISTTNENITEAKVRLLSDLGFNYIRVCVTCLDCFDEEITQADVAYLQKMDQIISWGLKYGLHISFQFSDYPGHIQYIDYDTNTINADSDFYTNEVKQERTIKLWQTIAKRYKGIPNQVLSFITDHEPDNPARTSGLVYDPYTEEDIERVSKKVIAAVAEVDSERLQMYESQYDLCMDSFMADAEVAQTSIYAANSFVYWNLDTDINLTGGYVPEWPYYEIPAVLNADKKSIVVDGTLPAGTSFQLTTRDIWGENNPTLTVTADAETLLSEECTQDEATYTFSLTETAERIEIAIDDETDGGVIFEKVLLILPNQYATDKYYFEGTKNAVTAPGTVEKRNNSELDINLGWEYSDYSKFSDESLEAWYDSPWILDEEKTVDLTITPDGGYISNYGYNADTLNKHAELYDKQREQYDTEGMNMELVTSAYIPVEETCEYLNDVLASYKKNEIGWALFYEMDLSAIRHPNSEWETVECGALLDTKILEVLQSYQGERPQIMVEVPDISHDYEEVTVDATYENAGYHALVCKHCGDEKEYEMLPKLQYSFYAALYESEECLEETKQELGGFANILELEASLKEKSGCLVLSLDKDSEWSKFPSGEGITSLVIESAAGENYKLTMTGTELTMGTDTCLKTDVVLQKQQVTLYGNGHTLTLQDMKLDGNVLITEQTSVICGERVSLDADISGLEVLSVNQNKSITEEGTNLSWDNVYGGAHVYINGAVTGVKELRMYGDGLYISSTGSLSVDTVSGIYGNVFLQKAADKLPVVSVQDTMKDMRWQLRIYVLELFPDGGVNRGEEGVLCNIEEGTVIAYVPAAADDSCIEKLGYMSGWDTWEDYENKTYTDGKLYYGAVKEVCTHKNSEVRGKIEASCTQKGYTGDVYCKDCEELISTGQSTAALGHDYVGKVTKQPTVTQEGVKTYTCSRCGTSYTEAIAQLTVSYTVKFNGNGNTSGSMKSQSIAYGSGTRLTENGFKKTGYTFSGWNTKKDGSGTKYANKADASKVTTEDRATVTLYAQWTANKYTIKFNGNGSTSGSTKQLQNCKYQKNYKLTANGFKRKGYSFNGWNTKKNGNGKTYKNKETVKNLTTKSGGTVTLYAQWKKTNYSITYKLNGGKNNKANPSKYTVTTKTITLKNPTRKGYNFKGWYSNKECTKKVTKIKKGSTGNVKLYAKWVKK